VTESVYRPAGAHNYLLAPAVCLCVECSREVLTRRCPAVSASGHQCGDWRGHRGDHSLLVCTTFAIAAARSEASQR
jgi:hypothetical protein